MNFESSILKKETLSKTAAKEKESLIEDFSKLMEKCCTYPVQTDEELREVIRPVSYTHLTLPTTSRV